MRTRLMVTCLSFLPVVLGAAAVERRYYTEARVAQMRQNLAAHSWARDQRAAILKRAEPWLSRDDNFLRRMVVPPSVPRGYDIHNLGCPVHGPKANEKGLYKWGISLERPYRIVCPAGGEEYPSNDFAAFLASGMKDRSLLTGPYADDGWGWQKGDEKPRYWFVAYYAHWSMMNFTMPAITDLARAAIVAEDEPDLARRCAHKCAVLLWQLAQYYPDYEYSRQSREGREHDPNYTGKWTNMIWEVRTPEYCAPAYDAIRPFLYNDAELERLAGQGAAQIDAAIRERLLLEAARCITDGSHRIAGNYGAHQIALLRVAQVLDEPAKHPTTAEMLRYIVANPAPASPQDVGFNDALLNLVYRDGMPPESIGYNFGWVRNLADIAVGLAEAGVDVFADARFRRLLCWPMDIVIAGKFTPALGDTGNLFCAGIPLTPTIAATVAPYMNDARIAAAARAEGAPRRDLFEKPSAEAPARPAADAAAVHPASYLMPGYGLACLQAGAGASAMGSLLVYGDYPQHAHSDQLNLLLFAHEVPLLTDVGYPEQTDAFNHRRFGFFNNTSAHTTVVVDAHRQGRGPGHLYAWNGRGFMQVADASCEGAYRQRVTLYRRANLLVEVRPGQCYLVDVFHVRGGKQHDYMALGAPAVTECEPPLGPVQASGTLAGVEVPYAHFYDDPKLAAAPLGTVSYGGYTGSGFQYFFNVRRAPLTGRAVFEWRLKEPGPGKAAYAWQGLSLRAHLVGTGDEIVAVDGKPQGYNYLPETIQYLVRRRTGANLASRFVTVFEPVKDQPFIRQVQAVPVTPDDGDAVAVRVELTDGAVHYVFHSLAPERAYQVDGRIAVTGQAASLALAADGRPTRAMLVNGTSLKLAEFALEGPGVRRVRVAAVDYRNGVVELTEPCLDAATVGEVAVVAPGSFWDCVRIRQVLDASHFSIGDEDLRVAGGPVSSVATADNRVLTPVDIPHARPGMAVLNGAGQVQGRVAKGERLTLDRGTRGPLRATGFPAAADGSAPRFTVVMLAPGDEILLPSVVAYERRP